MMNDFIQRKLVHRGLIFFTIATAYPSTTSYSACLLELVNGNAITTSGFWEEGGEIKFRAQGGIVGIARDRIREIRFCDPEPDLLEEDVQPSIASPIAPDVIHSSAEPGSRTSGIKGSGDVGAKTVEDMTRQKSALEIIRDEALKKFRSAVKTSDAAGRRKAMMDMLKASRGLVELIETMERINLDISED